MKKLLVKIITILIVILLISLLSVLVLYIMSHFTPLHPDAYRDMVRSIMIVSGFFFIPYVVMLFLGQFDWFKISFQGFQNWLSGLSPIKIISGSFTLVTLVNSLMMIVGIDTPKQGTFAYVHMLTRLGIIVLIIGVWKWRDMLILLTSTRQRMFWKTFCSRMLDQLTRSVSQLFTVMTLAYCVCMISLTSLLNPKGGTGFYLILLGLFLFSTVFVASMRLARKEE